MQTIIVTDIFGKSNALIALAKALNVTQIIDPYDGLDMRFKNEPEAYCYFSEQIGLDRYLQKAIECLSQSSDRVLLIGFSIGASVIWRLSELPTLKQIKQTLCFYGSQIRHYTDINPVFDIELIFPSSESHYDVTSLTTTLANKSHVNSYQVNNLHGFMNAHSDNYHDLAYQNQIKRLRFFVEGS
ncbi:MAG: dienelactone hydrolase family protein [Psychromonas sp.]